MSSSGGGTDSRGFGGLLIVDPAKSETPKWIRKVVRRYSNGDFENSSLLSGQSRGISLILHLIGMPISVLSSHLL